MALLDDPEVCALLGLPSPLCDCGCKRRLLPVGTKVTLARAPELRVGTVAAWTGQDHWTVPVNFHDHQYVMCLRNDLTVRKAP